MKPMKTPHPSRKFAVRVALMLATISPLGFLLASPARAGVSGENVILVVNARSADSRTVANHYAELRRIPSSNVIFLKDAPTKNFTTLDEFREKILKPVLSTINERKLARQARVVAYSVGFPTSVRIAEHTAKLTQPDQKKYQLPVGSINGLTYLYRFVLADDAGYLGWSPNLYARGPFERHFANPFVGEKAEKFNRANEDFNEGNYESAARAFADLAKKYPTLSPISVKAAQAFASSGDQASAGVWIVNALRGGWASKTFLADDSKLGPLVDTKFAEAVDKLSDAPDVLQGPMGFHADRSWTSSGHPISSAEGGVPYMMSCVLGVVHPRGSTVEQVIAHLTRSARADLSQPKGRFGFSKTADVRSKTRMPGVPPAIGRLMSQGFEPEIFKTPLPKSNRDYVGLLLGTATMNLRDRTFRLLPGAIAESLTSTGAAFDSASQTKCTELLHAGAAITSGAVAEPYSLQFKFPLPAMHCYYAEGTSAIEAFYLSVMSPYQLLIVGDPVCQPFARPPNESILFETTRGEQTAVVIKRAVSSLAKNPIRSAVMEIYAEGKLAKVTPSTDQITMRLPKDASGTIDFRVALIAPGNLETRTAFPRTVDLAGPLESPTIEIAGTDDTGPTIQLSCRGADKIELMHFGDTVGTVDGDQGRITVSRQDRGDGPLRLRPVAIFGDDRVRGPTLVVDD